MTDASTDQKESGSASTAAVSFKITYFPGGGRAFPLRLAAILGGIAFEDEFLTFPELTARRDAGKLRWRGIPELTVYGADGNAILTFGQSNACLRYIGSICGMYPATNVEGALVDELMDAVADVGALFAPSSRMKDQDLKKAARLALLSTEGTNMPYWFAKIEQRLQDNIDRGYTSGYFVGDTITVGDLKLFSMFMGIKNGSWDYIPATFLDDYKNICIFVAKLTAEPKIAKYMTEFTQRTVDFKAGNAELGNVKYAGKAVPGSLVENASASSDSNTN